MGPPRTCKGRALAFGGRFPVISAVGADSLREFGGDRAKRPAAAGQFFGGRQQVERVLGFEQRVGSPLGQTWCRLSLRWMDIVTGMDDEGWEADEVLLMAEPRFEALDAYTRAERHRVEGRSLAAIQVINPLVT